MSDDGTKKAEAWVLSGLGQAMADALQETGYVDEQHVCWNCELSYEGVLRHVMRRGDDYVAIFCGEDCSTQFWQQHADLRNFQRSRAGLDKPQ